MYVCVCGHVCECVYLCMCVWGYVWVCICVCVCVVICVYVCVGMCVGVYPCMCVGMYRCMRVCVGVLVSPPPLCAGHIPLIINVSLFTPGVHKLELSATGLNGASALSSQTFQINGILHGLLSGWECILKAGSPHFYLFSMFVFFFTGVSAVKCRRDVANAVLTVTCSPSAHLSTPACSIDGKSPHPCDNLAVLTPPAH